MDNNLLAGGIFIGGPSASAIVFDAAHVELIIAALASHTGDDAEEYTATDLDNPKVLNKEEIAQIQKAILPSLKDVVSLELQKKIEALVEKAGSLEELAYIFSNYPSTKFEWGDDTMTGDSIAQYISMFKSDFNPSLLTRKYGIRNKVMELIRFKDIQDAYQ